MLRIKNNVDLKELEKFGFKLDKYGDYIKMKDITIPCYCYGCENGNTNHSKEECVRGLYVNTKNLLIDRASYGGENSYWYNEMQSSEYNTLYDLIKADMVEKVEK